MSDELDRLPTGAEITAAANDRRAEELGLPPPKFTDAELTEFDRLCESTSSRDQVERISGRLKLKKFVADHGKPKCDAMYAELNRRQAKKRRK